MDGCHSPEQSRPGFLLWYFHIYNEIASLLFPVARCNNYSLFCTRELDLSFNIYYQNVTMFWKAKKRAARLMFASYRFDWKCSTRVSCILKTRGVVSDAKEATTNIRTPYDLHFYTWETDSRSWAAIRKLHFHYDLNIPHNIKNSRCKVWILCHPTHNHAFPKLVRRGR